MQVNLKDLERKQICPILFRHGWDYKSPESDQDFFRFCIKEMMGWQHRKGRGLSYDVLSSLISRLAVEKKIERFKISDVQLALKSFTNSGLYSKIEELVANVEIQIGIGKGHIVKDILPTVSRIGEKTCVITWNDNIKNIEDLRQSYQTRFASVWSFYSLNKYSVFYNLYFNENKIKHVKYKPNQFYIRDSRTFITKMVNLVGDDGLYPAPLEVCRECSRRTECRTSKTRTTNWQKSW